MNKALDVVLTLLIGAAGVTAVLLLGKVIKLTNQRIDNLEKSVDEDLTVLMKEYYKNNPKEREA